MVKGALPDLSATIDDTSYLLQEEVSYGVL